MNQQTFSSFFARPMSEIKPDELEAKYKQIRASVPADDETPFFRQLFVDCFGHHVSSGYMEDVPVLDPDNADPQRTVKDDDITAHFIGYLYGRDLDGPMDKNRNPINFLKICRSEVNSKEYDPEEFMEIVFAPSFSFKGKVPPKSGALGSNRIKYLEADIGSGKSLLMTHLLHQLRKSSQDRWGTIAIPVYFDYDHLFNEEKEVVTNLKENFFRICLQQMEMALCNWPHSMAINASDFCGEFLEKTLTWSDRQRLINFVNICAGKGIRFCLLFDNVDAFHYNFARHSFSDDGLQLLRQSFVENLRWLKGTFEPLGQLQSLGLCCLWAFRKSVLLHFKNGLEDVVPRSEASFGETFTLIPISANLILRLRLELLKRAWNAGVKQPRSLQQFAIFMTVLRQIVSSRLNESSDTEPKEVLVSVPNDLAKLGQHGHRSLIDFMVGLASQVEQKGDVFRRLFADPHPTLRVLFMADVRKRYSQAHNHFPNIFLCDATVQPDERFPEMHKPHRHTYWLKFLILKLVFESRSGVMGFHEVVSVFETCGYDRALIQLCIGSLCAENASACLRATGMFGAQKRWQLQVTDRGSKLLKRGWFTGKETDNELAFNFDYLQLVIDDYLMSFPVFTATRDKITNGDEKKSVRVLDAIYIESDLSYLLAPQRAFYHQSHGYLEKKISAAAYFLRVLEASFKEEAMALNALFDICPEANLSKRFEAIERNFSEGATRVLRSDQSMITTPKDLRESLKYDKSFEAFFDRYFESGVNVCAP
jgi:hypothetical protein